MPRGTFRRCAGAVTCSVRGDGAMSLAGSLRKLAPRSLLVRSLLIIVMPLIIVQIVSAYVFYENHWNTVTRRLVNGLVGDVVAVVEMLQAFPGEENRLRVFAIAAEMNLEVRLRGGAIDEPTRESDADTFLESTLIQAMQESLDRPFRIDLASREREVELFVQVNGGVLDVVTPRKRLESSTTYVFVLWMVGSSLLLFGVATLFMRNQVRSVRRLAAAADRFGKGRDVPDFKPEGAAEVRQAAIAFNLMRERIRRQIAQRTEMLAGVSHDLRTPLTRMKLELAMMGDREGVAELAQDVAEMERMIEGYLAFARGEGAENMRDTDLVALLEDVAARARREGGEVDLHCEGDIVMPLRPHAIERALTNLIGNAVRYASHVWVRAGLRGEVVDVVIDDNGPGIPADRREDAFRAFFRLDTSRNPETGGVGLGLTIARDVVRAHGGDVLLEESPLGGLRVRVRLPL